MVVLVKQNYKLNKKLYNETAKKIKEYVDSRVEIEHVGSTAIPNMYGKNIIDILLGVDDEKLFATTIDILQNLGYYPSSKSSTEIYRFFANKLDETGAGDIHIHLVIKNTDRYNDFIMLRDYLLASPKEASDYSKFKIQLLKNDVSDRSAYRKAKSAYVDELIKRAKDYYKNQKN